jgi:hypothetical protein
MLYDLRSRFSDECERLGEAAVRKRIVAELKRAAADGGRPEDHVAVAIRASFSAPAALGEKR